MQIRYLVKQEEKWFEKIKIEMAKDCQHVIELFLDGVIGADEIDEYYL